MVKKILKKNNIIVFLYGIVCQYKNRLLSPLLTLMARYFPEWHCLYYTRRRIGLRHNKKYVEKPNIDLKNPKYFEEKLLWLKYYVYNKSSLIMRCYDKYTVREFVKEQGCGNTLNEIYGVWNSIQDIPWGALPNEYVLKVSNGCGNHVFKRKEEPFDVEKAKRTLKKAMVSRNNFAISGDLFAGKMPQKIICEHLIVTVPAGKTLPDFKFYCFHGEPKYLLYIWDRYDGTKHAFFDEKLNDKSNYRNDAISISMIKPDCYDEMIDIARKLSKPFPFVRVDLYVKNNKPIFGELTFTPAGGLVLNHVYKTDGTVNYNALTEMGNLIHLERMTDYPWLFD